MILTLLAFIGGALTIISPCILPVLPFVFARAGKPFLTSTLPMLVGMAASFAAVATLAAVGGGWAVTANQYGRAAALVVLAGFGVILLFPALADRVTRPVVALGNRLNTQARQGGSDVGTSALLGVATGLLWAPCAGPVLGVILTGAALNGASLGTSVLLLAYALGASASLALAIFAGGPVFKAMKRSLYISDWLRRGAGAVVLASVALIGLGWDTTFLTRASFTSTGTLEQNLLDTLAPPLDYTKISAQDLPIEGIAPDLSGAVQWLNSDPLTLQGLKGKVVLVEFWTYSCINCLNVLPHVKVWADKYKDKGLVVIGVHTPEFAYEKDLGNVRNALKDLGITFPVAVDSNYAVWRAYQNHYWPAMYFIDAKGQIRHHHFGEGSYDESEKVIQQLLADAGFKVTDNVVTTDATGPEQAL